jgi:hypothetical protein
MLRLTPEDIMAEITGLLGMEREQGKQHLKREHQKGDFMEGLHTSVLTLARP